MVISISDPTAKELELSLADYQVLKKRAKDLAWILLSRRLIWILCFVETIGVDAIKIASADLFIGPLIDAAIKTESRLF